jgi:hypothetical protein
MQRYIVSEIHTTLQGIAHNPLLYIGDNFVARSHALERLASRVLDRIEDVLYEHGYQPDLAQLYQQAEQVWHRLERINTELFAGLRQQLATIPHPASMLQHMFATYIGHIDDDHQDPSGYDCLDTFVDGLLGIGFAPDTVHRLESGMIGYHPTPARVILALLEHTRLGRHDVFYDVGSGLGRVALLASLLSPATSKGIEVEPAYATYATQCARRFTQARVTYENVDARVADYADGTVFFLYTPFTGRMLDVVLERLHTQALERRITVAAYGLCTRRATELDWLQLMVRQEFGHETLAVLHSQDDLRRPR